VNIALVGYPTLLVVQRNSVSGPRRGVTSDGAVVATTVGVARCLRSDLADDGAAVIERVPETIRVAEQSDPRVLSRVIHPPARVLLDDRAPGLARAAAVSSESQYRKVTDAEWG
jgi:hypothetical protein